MILVTVVLWGCAKYLGAFRLQQSSEEAVIILNLRPKQLGFCEMRNLLLAPQRKKSQSHSWKSSLSVSRFLGNTSPSQRRGWVEGYFPACWLRKAEMHLSQLYSIICFSWPNVGFLYLTTGFSGFFSLAQCQEHNESVQMLVTD